MKKRYLFLIIFILTGIVMYLTNPAKEKHQKAVYNELDEVIQEEKGEVMSKNPQLAKMLDGLNNNALKEMVLPFVEQAVDVENYKVFSLTKIDIGQGKFTVGLGVFGKVFIAPQFKQKVKENINKYL